MSKRKKTYRILVNGWGDGGYMALAIMAEPIEIPGWEDIELIIHRHISDRRIWHITDVETGLILGMGCPYKQDAIDDATRQLSQSTMRKYRQAQNKSIKQYGKPSELPLMNTKGVIV